MPNSDRLEDSKVPARPGAPKQAIDQPDDTDPAEQPNPGDPGPAVLKPGKTPELGNPRR
ncbi:MAG: hypothetical protein JWN48_3203 [Myxococcaceae bacterium]|nr:hypothetical protein [Myxococcaceae bacterium]